MRTMSKAALPCLLLSVLLIGCSKTVKVTFINDTDVSRELILSGIGEHPGHLGTLAPMGVVTVKIKVDRDLLPVTYSWDAGDKDGGFPVSEDSPERLWVDIDTGQYRDKHTEIRKQRKVEIKEQPIIQEPVIE